MISTPWSVDRVLAFYEVEVIQRILTKTRSDAVSKYDSERERIYQEVHDDKSRLLAAAEADIEILKQENARLKDRVVALDFAYKGAMGKTLVTEKHAGFARDLEQLCRVSGVILSSRDEGMCLDIATGDRDYIKYVPYWARYSDGSGCVLLEEVGEIK